MDIACYYHVAEERATEAIHASCKRSTSCPEVIVKTKGLHTGLAFDNLNRLVNIPPGTEALYDTVVIIYRNVDHIFFIN